MKNSLLILICLALSLSICYGQDSKADYTVGVHLAVNLGYWKDSNYSTLNYRQSGLEYGLYLSRQKKNLIRVQANFSPSNLTTHFSDFFETRHWNGNLWFSYLFGLSNRDQKLNYFIGPEYRFNGNLIDWQNLNGWSFLFAHNLNLGTAVQYQIADKQRIDARLSLPIISDVVRPPYNGYDEDVTSREHNTLKLVTVGEWMTFNKFQSADLSLNYNYEVLDRLELRLAYELQVQRVRTNSHTWILGQHQFLLGSTFKF